jgi:Tfp pilus assembly protein PilV
MCGESGQSSEIRQGRRGGWSLVELLVAMLSGAVLALAVGAMLVFTVRAHQRHMALTDMQGDLRVAVPALAMAIREARDADVKEPAPFGTGARLTLGRRSFYRANNALAYDAAGSSLVYDPDTNVVNNTMVLSRGKVKTFQCIRGTNSITFSIALQEPGANAANVAIDGETFFRN